MKARLRRVGIGSVFLLALVIYGMAGLLVGGLVALAASVPLPEGYRLTLLDRLGAWALVLFPVVYGLAGGLFAALAAALYNLAAAVTGGITVVLSGPEASSRLEISPEGSGAAPPQEEAADAGSEEAPEPSSRDSGE